MLPSAGSVICTGLSFAAARFDPHAARQAARIAEKVDVRSVVIVVIIYISAMVAVAATVQQLARAHPRYQHIPVSVDGPFELVIDRYQPLPLGLDGHGRAPGEVSVINSHGVVLDSERLDDVFTVRNVRWEQFKVHFDFDRDGNTYESSLALEP